MPELPEVETVRSVLLPYIVGQKINTTIINLPKILKNIKPLNFCEKINGQTITNFTRRGKFLTLHLESGAYVVIHFRMTGTLTVEKTDTPTEKHTHLILNFTNGQSLRFVDARGFGHWWYFDKNQQDTSGQLQLGPEPNAITLTYLRQKFAKRQVALKTALLDQHLIAGIGNIYADEICFRAQILPTKPVAKLSESELKRLVAEIPTVIDEFIQVHRVPFAVFAVSKGKSYQKSTNRAVYGRKDQPCKKCGHPLTGIRIGQRSSVFCKHCQK